MANCTHNNPLQLNGTSQRQRLLPAMQDNYVHIDEKKYEDWIVFAAEFSRYLRFYELNGLPAGDWNPFFGNDVSAVLGTIAIQDVDAYRRTVKASFDFIKNNENARDINSVKQKLNELFSVLFTLSKAIDEFVRRLPTETSLKTTMQSLIKTKLAMTLPRLLSYYKAADEANPRYIETSNFKGWKVLNEEVIDATEIVYGDGLRKEWWLNAPQTSWEDYVNSVTADEGIFNKLIQIDLTTDDADTINKKLYNKINHAANHNLFIGVFNQYLTIYSNIVQEAKKQLLQTLQQLDTHAPHYALFLTFLRLFTTTKDQINTLKQKHLDYYYKDILQLTPKKTLPNQAHILLELAKHVNDFLLRKDTLLKAGKDSLGNDILYAPEKDWTFNNAKVALLKSVYIGAINGDDDIASGNRMINNQFRVFASPVANSADGLGAPLTSLKEWHPFTNKVYVEGELANINMPLAEIGFAVASHYLYLTEGERRVSVRIVTENNKDQLLNDIALKCYLTTEKGWYPILSTTSAPISFTNAGKHLSDNTPCAELGFSIPGNAPAIINYDAKIHGGTFNVALPLLKVILVNDQSNSNQYKYYALKDITITKVELEVEVGTTTENDLNHYNNTGLKQLLLSNDFGPVDASKTFQPFGPQPKKDTTFVIGNKELFSKENAKFTLNIEWAKLPTSSYYIKYTSASDTDADTPKVTATFLSGGVWENSNEDDLFHTNNDTPPTPTPTIPVFTSHSIPASAIVDYTDEYAAYNSSSKAGFIRLVLKDEFGYNNYLNDLTTHLITISKPKENVTSFGGKEPYTPTIQSLYLSYIAYKNTDIISNNKQIFEDSEIRFFHLYPFGEAEQHAYLNGNEHQYLLPQFTWPLEAAFNNCSGEFYIGIENLKAEQSVNILFQVLDGSTNPAIQKPDDHITWSYLANNAWINFREEEINDATRQLVQSGIISFTIPTGATTDNTILPSGYLWIKAGIEEAAEAVCKLISVDAQAALVSLKFNNNADDLFETALPANSITKLKEPNAAVKKILQPYASFGGRPKEQTEHYYIRVSERLRHKARAITIWDYERLVLEAFPDIHKVKCLNHTQITDSIYNELQPGYVSIITIPSLVNRNETDPLRPYTNANKLLEIEEYLNKKISCHVNVCVRNPQFEEVRLNFLLKLRQGYDDFTFYSKQLKDEITAFLTPWAYNSETDIQFGGKIYKSSLINFIEERIYVDFITNVEMYHRIEENGAESQNAEEIIASTARSILVSAPASKHIICPFPDGCR
jgi:hypothetical protein